MKVAFLSPRCLANFVVGKSWEGLWGILGQVGETCQKPGPGPRGDDPQGARQPPSRRGKLGTPTRLGGLCPAALNSSGLALFSPLKPTPFESSQEPNFLPQTHPEQLLETSSSREGKGGRWGRGPVARPALPPLASGAEPGRLEPGGRRSALPSGRLVPTTQTRPRGPRAPPAARRPLPVGRVCAANELRCQLLCPGPAPAACVPLFGEAEGERAGGRGGVDARSPGSPLPAAPPRRCGRASGGGRSRPPAPRGPLARVLLRPRGAGGRGRGRGPSPRPARKRCSQPRRSLPALPAPRSRRSPRRYQGPRTPGRPDPPEVKPWEQAAPARLGGDGAESGSLPFRLDRRRRRLLDLHLSCPLGPPDALPAPRTAAMAEAPPARPEGRAAAAAAAPSGLTFQDAPGSRPRAPRLVREAPAAPRPGRRGGAVGAPLPPRALLARPPPQTRAPGSGERRAPTLAPRLTCLAPATLKPITQGACLFAAAESN